MKKGAFGLPFVSPRINVEGGSVPRSAYRMERRTDPPSTTQQDSPPFPDPYSFAREMRGSSFSFEGAPVAESPAGTLP